jgi:hypothetical protein
MLVLQATGQKDETMPPSILMVATSTFSIVFNFKRVCPKKKLAKKEADLLIIFHHPKFVLIKPFAALSL